MGTKTYYDDMDSIREDGTASKEMQEEVSPDEMDDGWKNPSKDWLNCDFNQFLAYMKEWYGEGGVPNIPGAIRGGRLPQIKGV